MQNLLKTLRKEYFIFTAELVPRKNIQFVVLTHFLEDRPELLEAITSIAPISLLIGIPYSIHKATLSELENHYITVTPSLEQLYDCEYLVSLITKHLKPDVPVVLLEIGGYFAPILQILQKKLNGILVGSIEDTEAGHKQYEKIIDKLACPVISVARSPLKDTEDFLVGTSCLYSTEKLLRTSGFPIEGKRSLVLGFGKIGRGIAHALLRHHCPVSVYDIDPIRRINALSEGFQAQDREEAFKHAEIIYGTTGTCSIKGEDFKLIKDGALLVSCSSKDIEFDLTYLQQNYQKSTIFDGLDSYESGSQIFYVAANGRPVNFIDGAVIGPILALVQAEIILAIKQLFEIQGKKGIFETSIINKRTLAEKWLHHFCDGKSGRYRVGINSKTKISRISQNNLETIVD